MSTSRITRHIRASRSVVYRALLDPDAVQQWMVPDRMTSHIHDFEPEEGGYFRISLTYEETGNQGKTSSHTDTFHGQFVELVPDTKVVQSVEFETDQAELMGVMTITYELADAQGGTHLVGIHEDVPSGLKPEDNELGWRMSLDKLARLVENGAGR